MRIVLALCALPLIAAEPAGFNYWSAAELKGFDQKLSNGKKVTTQSLAVFKNHTATAAHREGDGQAELHEHDADLFVIESGSATLVVGGRMPGAATSAPGELRAAAIEGGTKRTLSAGDIVHIPSRTPHQMLIAPGTKVTYFVLKVKEP